MKVWIICVPSVLSKCHWECACSEVHHYIIRSKGGKALLCIIFILHFEVRLVKILLWNNLKIWSKIFLKWAGPFLGAHWCENYEEKVVLNEFVYEFCHQGCSLIMSSTVFKNNTTFLWCIARACYYYCYYFSATQSSWTTTGQDMVGKCDHHSPHDTFIPHFH